MPRDQLKDQEYFDEYIAFLVDYTSQTEQRSLKYEADEYSFDTEPSVQEINFDVVLNRLNLTVAEDNKVVQIWGFCPYGEWIKGNHDVPKHERGALKITDDLDPGFAYAINKDEDWPVYVNTQTGWLCIGDPEGRGEAVEFIANCVAVVDNKADLLSLWLKPYNLPML